MFYFSDLSLAKDRRNFNCVFRVQFHDLLHLP